MKYLVLSLLFGCVSTLTTAKSKPPFDKAVIAAYPNAKNIWIVKSYSGWADVGADALVEEKIGFVHLHAKPNTQVIAYKHSVNPKKEILAVIKKAGTLKNYKPMGADGVIFHFYDTKKNLHLEWRRPENHSKYAKVVKAFHSLRKGKK